MLRALVSLYGEDPATIVRILDVCQELKALPQVTNLSQEFNSQEASFPAALSEDQP